MADFVFNIAVGKAGQYFQNVEDDSPAAAVIRIFVIDANGETDANMKDVDNMTALFALLANEVTNTNYANKSLTDADITVTLDDGNDRLDVDIDSDPVFSTILAGDDWTDIIIAYDADGTDNDANTIPLLLQDFAVTPDGTDIKIIINAAGIYRAVSS